MRVIALFAAFTALLTVSAAAQTPPPKKNQQPVVRRTAAGTVIQPTRTIIHNPDGTTTIITVQRRSYLDPGTEVPVGYPGSNDYAFPPGGDPGRPYSFAGPDLNGVGGYALARPYWLPGYNPSPAPY